MPTICPFYLKGTCRFGLSCHNQHVQPGQGKIRHTSAACFFDKSTVEVDMKEKPLWPLSVYAPSKDSSCFVAGTDMSPEESRWLFVQSMRSTGNISQYMQAVQAAYTRVQADFTAIAQNTQAAIDAFSWVGSVLRRCGRTRSTTTSAFGGGSSGSSGGSVFGAGTGALAAAVEPARLVLEQARLAAAAVEPPAAGTTSAFGGASAFGKPAFGQSAFGQAATPATAPSAAAAATPGSAFGQSAFGQTATATPDLRLDSLRLDRRRCGCCSCVWDSLRLGQTATPAFGQSAFGQTATPAPAASAFGQPAAPSAFGQPTTSAFGQPAAPSAFGQPAFGSGLGGGGGGGASAFGQPAATATPAPQLAFQASGLSLPQGQQQQAGPPLSSDPIEAAFMADMFEFGKIPETEPPMHLRR
ncbi:hypothetical protein BC831DRAFT_434350 [Entophlyctis helioformis]|nr:hypothetical protein BC831DRAFT_434350 [Entophlyctis helioformis]